MKWVCKKNSQKKKDQYTNIKTSDNKNIRNKQTLMKTQFSRCLLLPVAPPLAFSACSLCFFFTLNSLIIAPVIIKKSPTYTQKKPKRSKLHQYPSTEDN